MLTSGKRSGCSIDSTARSTSKSGQYKWCEEGCCTRTSLAIEAVAYRNGMTLLLRLNYLFARNVDGAEVFSLPPNQRWNIRSLADGSSELPASIPLRGAEDRLSLALEHAGRGSFEAIGELLQMESDYIGYVDRPSAARAVFFSRLLRAELAIDAGDDEAGLRQLTSIPTTFDLHQSSLANRIECDELVATALGSRWAAWGGARRQWESTTRWCSASGRGRS